MTSEWEHFVAGLSPALLEKERAHVHGDIEQERVGSRTDLQMRAAHDFIRHDVWAKAWRDREDVIRRTQEADADLAIWQQQHLSVDAVAREDAIADYQHHNEAARAAYLNRRTAA